MIPGTPKDIGPPYGKLPILFPYLYGFEHGSGNGNSMGPKGSQFLGVPENPTDFLHETTHCRCKLSLDMRRERLNLFIRFIQRSIMPTPTLCLQVLQFFKMKAGLVSTPSQTVKGTESSSKKTYPFRHSENDHISHFEKRNKHFQKWLWNSLCLVSRGLNVFYPCFKNTHTSSIHDGSLPVISRVK